VWNKKRTKGFFTSSQPKKPSKYKALVFFDNLGETTRMAHLRRRHAHEIYEKLLKLSPLIGIFGHRQVGKTTFLEQVCQAYRTFDDMETLKAAQQDSSRFLKGLRQFPAGIDESQMCVELFPALKEHVRKHKHPGQFVLSGSVRFYSRKAIRESLTGRIINVDMLPLVLTELADDDRATLPLRLITKTSFTSDWETSLGKKILNHRGKLINLYFNQGGLPGICFLRNERVRSERIREQLQLMLDRDLRLVHPSTIPYTQILNFVSQLTTMEGEAIQPTVLRRTTGITEVTQKKILFALENIFLIRQISIEGDRRGLSLYFEDQAEGQSLAEQKSDPLKQFEGLVYRNLRASFFYEMGLDFRVFQYRESPDVRIPFAIKTKEGCLGILPILEESPSRKHRRIAQKFLQRYSPANVLIVTKGFAETRILEPRMLQIPAERLLFE
jgi:predicted AAA+ superfamily ATPase